VQSSGVSAMSFPPTDTTSTSSASMLSRMNSSCGSRRPHARSFNDVASTAVFRHPRLFAGTLLAASA